MLKVLQIAQAEVGTRESGDNGTLYARDLETIIRKVGKKFKD